MIKNKNNQKLYKDFIVYILKKSPSLKCLQVYSLHFKSIYQIKIIMHSLEMNR